MGGRRRWAGVLWAAGFVLAAAAGISFALWRAPHGVVIPASTVPVPDVPPEPAPPLLAAR